MIKSYETALTCAEKVQTACIKFLLKEIQKNSVLSCNCLEVTVFYCLLVVSCPNYMQNTPQGWICLDNFICCHTVTEVEDQSMLVYPGSVH